MKDCFSENGKNLDDSQMDSGDDWECEKMAADAGIDENGLHLYEKLGEKFVQEMANMSVLYVSSTHKCLLTDNVQKSIL